MNGHSYEVISSLTSFTWEEARLDAIAHGGQLATITSAAENDFIYEIVRGYWPWLGGFQIPGSPEPTGGWAWVTGEPFIYTNWRAGEPNNVGPNGEHFLGYFDTSVDSGWNDLPFEGGPFSYVLEFEPLSIPEPGTLLALGTGLVGIAVARRRRR